VIFRPGLYPILGRDLELFTAVLTEWCFKHNRYACYVHIAARGLPVLCRPVDETAIIMLQDAHLLPAGLLRPHFHGLPVPPPLSLLE